MKNQNRGGFTLLEILVVIVIITLVALFAGWMITSILWFLGAAVWFAFQFLPLLMLIALIAATWFGVMRLFDKA